MSKYLGGFSDRENVADEFQVNGRRTWWAPEKPKPTIPDDFPTDDQIVIAIYDNEGYEGSAYVLWHKGGKVFEVRAGHCSCYGLEDQWVPEETSLEALAKRLRDGDYGPQNTDEAKAIIKEFLDRMGQAEYQGA